MLRKSVTISPVYVAERSDFLLGVQVWTLVSAWPMKSQVKGHGIIARYNVWSYMVSTWRFTYLLFQECDTVFQHMQPCLGWGDYVL